MDSDSQRLIREPEGELRLPLVHVRLLARVGQVELNSAAPALTHGAIGNVEAQALLARPCQQISRGICQLIRMTEMCHRGEPPCRQGAGKHLAISGYRTIDRYAGLKLEVARHVDHVVLEERRSRGRDAVCRQPGVHIRGTVSRS